MRHRRRTGRATPARSRAAAVAAIVSTTATRGDRCFQAREQALFRPLRKIIVSLLELEEPLESILLGHDGSSFPSASAAKIVRRRSRPRRSRE